MIADLIPALAMVWLVFGILAGAGIKSELPASLTGDARVAACVLLGLVWPAWVVPALAVIACYALWRFLRGCALLSVSLVRGGRELLGMIPRRPRVPRVRVVRSGSDGAR